MKEKIEFEESSQKSKICVLVILERENKTDRREVIIKNMIEDNFYQLIKDLNIQNKRIW
jgi:hypothetical protein